MFLPVRRLSGRISGASPRYGGGADLMTPSLQSGGQVGPPRTRLWGAAALRLGHALYFCPASDCPYTPTICSLTM
jgi:hypothetical protein